MNRKIAIRIPGVMLVTVGAVVYWVFVHGSGALAEPPVVVEAMAAFRGGC